MAFLMWSDPDTCNYNFILIIEEIMLKIGQDMLVTIIQVKYINKIKVHLLVITTIYI